MSMKKLITILLCAFGMQLSHSQIFATSIGMTGGAVDNGFGGNASLNFHLGRYSYIQLGIFSSFSNENVKGLKVPYKIFSAQPSYYHRIFFVKSKEHPFAGYLGGGVVLGDELINKGREELDNGAIIDAKSKFILGALISLEVEWIYKKDFSFVAKINQHYHANSDIGELYPFAGIGFRYYFN